MTFFNQSRSGPYVSRMATPSAVGNTVNGVRYCRPDLRPTCSRIPNNGAQPAHSRWIGLRSEEHTSELQSRENIVCRLLLEKKKIKYFRYEVNLTNGQKTFKCSRKYY